MSGKDDDIEGARRDEANALKLKLNLMLPTIRQGLPIASALAKEVYDASIKAGFNERQAIQLASDYLQRMILGDAPNGKTK